MKFLLPDGTGLDGVGHVLDIFVSTMEDGVLEKAVWFLFEGCGVQ